MDNLKYSLPQLPFITFRMSARCNQLPAGFWAATGTDYCPQLLRRGLASFTLPFVPLSTGLKTLSSSWGSAHFKFPSPGAHNWFPSDSRNPVLGYNFPVSLTLTLSLCGLTRLMRNHREARKSGELESQTLQVCNGTVLQVTKQGCILNRSQSRPAIKILGVS